MLTKDEKDYLKKIPASKKASIKPFDQQAKKVGDSVVSKIKKALPKVKVLFMGSTALGIAGQNDIDIYVLSEPKDFGKYLPNLKKLLVHQNTPIKLLLSGNSTKVAIRSNFI